jgi:4-hydroxybenzoate polyprenyltransferase
VVTRGARERLSLWIELSRPFTLLPPLLGMWSGAATALGAMRFRSGLGAGDAARAALSWHELGPVLAGGVFAAAMNAASNAINQVTDLENDRINKPDRPIPSGRASSGEAIVLAVVLYVVSLAVAALIRPGGRIDTFVIACGGAFASIAYSVPPFRTKRHGTGANVTIALARGCLLKVCGWSCIAPVFSDPEPWWIGGTFFFFLLGAASTKDFADIKGDRAAGCMTWPVVYGPRRAAYMVAPFLVLPWLLIPLGALLPGPDRDHLLSGRPIILVGVALLLSGYGIVTARSILRDPDALATTENHPSWTHMYRQMMLAQVGTAAAYWI